MPLNRHAALINLSRDHHLFLLEARRIRWLIENDERSGTLNDVVDSVLHFWKDIGEIHLLEEETVLFPAYLEATPLAKRDIDALITDHTWLRDKLLELADLPRYENCSPLLISLADYIVNHLRQEEHIIFEQIQNTLDETALDEIAKASQAFRAEHHRAVIHEEELEDLFDLLQT
jgi:hemerythrin-like domain-containing protein